MSTPSKDLAFDRAVAAIADTSYSIACEHAVLMGAAGMTPRQVVESIGMGHWLNPTWDDAVYALAHAHRTKCATLPKAAPVAQSLKRKDPPEALEQYPILNPGHQPGKSKKTKRRCLKCRDLFESEGPHNHICPTCQRTNRSNYSGTDMGGPYA